ncbi:MAG: hypothetical protein RL018_1169, partial [Pseudomonadota bacterium]
MDFSSLNPAVVIWSFLALVVFNIIAVLWFAVRKADKQATEAAVQAKHALLGAVSTTSERLERELRREISESSRGGRQELTQNLGVFQQQLQALGESNTRRMNDVRDTLDKQLLHLQTTNSAKLDEMRATVDEKLQATLQARLGESFKQVADRLEQVHKGLGEMQTLAQG